MPIAYNLSGWTSEQRGRLLASLLEHQIAHRWDGATRLLVTREAQPAVDQMVEHVSRQPDERTLADEPVLADGRRLASYAARLGGWVIDALATSVIWLLVFDRTDPAAAGPSALAGLLGLAVLALYTVVPVALTGRTLGKLAVRARVERLDGGLPGWGAASIRFLVPWAVAIAALVVRPLAWLDPPWQAVVYGWVLTNPRRRGLHDLAAGTVVVTTR